jgi:hypothetical protein
LYPVSVQAVAVVQRAMRGQAPEAVMAELGFGPLLLIKAFPVSMSGVCVWEGGDWKGGWELCVAGWDGMVCVVVGGEGAAHQGLS